MSISTVLMRLRSPPEMPRTIALPTHVSAHLLTAQSSDKPTINKVIAIGPGSPAHRRPRARRSSLSTSRSANKSVLNAMYAGIEVNH